LLSGPAEIAIVGASDVPDGGFGQPELVRTAWMSLSPGAVIAVDADGSSAPVWAPLLNDRGLVDGRAAAYVCRHFVCGRPVTESVELARLLTPTANIDSTPW